MQEKKAEEEGAPIEPQEEKPSSSWTLEGEDDEDEEEDNVENGNGTLQNVNAGNGLNGERFVN